MNIDTKLNLLLEDIIIQEKLKNKKIIILGETHSNWNEIQSYFKLIKKFKPEYYLHELVFEDVCLSKKVLKNRLDNCDKENLCDSKFNKFIYQFAYDNNLKLVGIDLDRNFNGMDIKEQFKLREEHMLNIINKYIKKSSKIVIQLGDTHLRTIKTKELGNPSLIYETFKNRSDVLIIRSKTKEID